MDTTTQIEHLIQTLAEHLYLIDQSETEISSTSRTKGHALYKVASKTVEELENLGVPFHESFDRAKTINQNRK